MAPVSVHQVIHGYRDGHRLLSSSLPIGSEASRAMLVLSDMSGPTMQPGFDEYLTAYPLPGSDLFVFAKTWYAPEMHRPGCVWTHSLLFPRVQIAQVSSARLLDHLRRPHAQDIESAASTAIVLDDDAPTSSSEAGFADRTISAALVGAVFGQSRPVLVYADSSAQLEPAFLRLWEELWPSEKARFAFCTGALAPRSVAGALLDLQAVPRAILPSQFRKSASAALVIDLRALRTAESWVESLLDGSARDAAGFRAWLEAAAGADAGRAVVPSLMPIFGQWCDSNLPADAVLAGVISATDLESSIRSRLVGMVLDRAASHDGPARRRDLLQYLCGHRSTDLSPIVAKLEEQVRRIFEESRAEGLALVLSLLGDELTDVGERVLRTAVLLLVPSDIDILGDAEAPFLSTIVGANPALASSPALWKRAGSRTAEILSQLGTVNQSDDERSAVVDAILSSGRDVSVDTLVRFGGKSAIFRGLAALSTSQIQYSWQWRSALSAQPGAVLEWLESQQVPSLHDLELGSRFVSPKGTRARLAMVWRNGTANGGSLSPRVAAFGLSLAFSEGNTRSPLFASCFQPTYDAAGSSGLEYDEWEWLREYAPSSSWWRDWDKCERLAAALARLLERQNALLETVLGIVHSGPAMRKVAAILDNGWGTRPYLKSLRSAAEASNSIGTREQRDALLEER